MRAGMREVLPLPLVHRAFHEAMDRIEIEAGVTRMRDGKVLAFIACKGGSGATFLSTNLRLCAGRAGRKEGAADRPAWPVRRRHAVRIGPEAAMTLSDVCSQIERMDGAFLESCLVHVAPNFGVLACGRRSQSHGGHEAGTHGPSCAWRASTSTTSCSTWAARSTPFRCARWTRGRDLPGAATGAARHPRRPPPARHLPFARLSGERTRLIVNRYEKGGKLRLADLEQALGAPVLHTIPNDYIAATDSVNQGVPVLQLSRTAPLRAALPTWWKC
jgi:pilus assembly protein CpaE